MTAYVSEIFSSVQGEGPCVGERHLFVRFCECHRHCIYCDTPTERTDTVKVEKQAGSGEFEEMANPLSVEQVAESMNPIPTLPNGRHRKEQKRQKIQVPRRLLPPAPGVRRPSMRRLKNPAAP